MVYLGRPHHFKSFKGCLPQILLGPFLNTLTHIISYSKTFKSCLNSEVYSEPSQTSKMVHFEKIVNGYKSLFLEWEPENEI